MHSTGCSLLTSDIDIRENDSLCQIHRTSAPLTTAEGQTQNLNPQNSYWAASETCIFFKSRSTWVLQLESVHFLNAWCVRPKHTQRCFCTTLHLHLQWAHGHLLCTQNLNKTAEVNINVPAAFQEYNLIQPPWRIWLRIILLRHPYLIVPRSMCWIGRNKSGCAI